MACRPEGVPKEGEGVHPVARRAEPAASRTATGEGREALRVRGAEGEGNTGQPLRPKKPADRLSLHVWAGMERGLPELLVPGRYLRRRRSAPGAARHDLRGDLAGRPARDRS